MATNKQVINTLIQAAENLREQELNSEETNQLIRLFNQGSGASYERALRTLSQYTDLNQNEILNRAAESEDLDSILMDLQFQMENWRPGS